jgi:ABA responsive element binding factor
VFQPPAGSGGVAAGGRLDTLGEMTLEDFLIKAVVVRGSLAGHGQGHAAAAVGMVPAGPMGMQQGRQLASAPMMFQVAPQGNAVYPMMGDGGMGYHNGAYPGGGMAAVPPSQCVAAAAVSPGSSDGMSAMTQGEMMGCIGNGGMSRNGGNARKRESPEDGYTEKTVERRQRRMIKNRESAARSRARKQVRVNLIAFSVCVWG